MTENLQILISGVSLGCLYALLALGFVVVSRATGVLNLTQGGFVVIGAYLTYLFSQTLGLPYFVGMGLSIIATALIAGILEALVVHRIANTNLFTPILVTFGLVILIPPIVAGFWGNEPLTSGDPWGLSVLRIGDLSVTHKDLAVVLLTAVILVLFLGFIRYSRLGLAMQATAIDPEAALAQGVSDRTVHRLAWSIAGALGAVAGTMLATAASGGVRPSLEHYALLALPVIILGGIESPLGAVVGGLVMGIVQQFAVVKVPDSFGKGFEEVVPYLVMILILLIKPEGLFGTRKVRRL
ncbi:branched-chain amino acid ABC transporter permease [Intrasporangium sp.]|uniref:branched-chain amino acid ABC transporter permease n=1 Tax=Intrasporangium sp. TaxID=1925024 RepID=UPI002939F876|nr:branched-chain amino acid ABC transporter permease [Intrasporangium sp.]MDV3221162.1 branched-chain amino acid ABC transporter permease [Intrasporangium sp.]